MQAIHLTTLPAQDFADAAGMFAAIFGTPLDERDVEAILQPAASGAFAPLAGLSALHSQVEALADLVRDLGDAGAAVSRLNRDYCLLFLGAGGPGAAPFESAYRGNGRLFQQPAADMAEMLAQCGLSLAENFPEAPDHLAVELTLLQESLCRAASCGDADAIAAATALLERLREWVPLFTSACRKNDLTGFYAGVASLLEQMLRDGIAGEYAPPFPPLNTIPMAVAPAPQGLQEEDR